MNKYPCAISIGFSTNNACRLLAFVSICGALLDSAARAAAPIATTLPASGVSNTVATLNGTVNPGGAATTAWFEWGVSANGQRTTNFPVGSGVVASNLTQALSGLTAGVVYHARIAASNSAGLLRAQEVLLGSPSLLVQGAAMMTNFLGEPYVEPGVSSVGALAAAAGSSHGLALRGDGTVIGWGYNGNGQTTITGGLSNVVAIAASDNHSLALRKDGTVAGWGDGLTNIPPGLSNVVAISAGTAHSLGLRSDGTVVAWGINGFGVLQVPAGLSNVIAIAAGEYHNLVLRSDGTVVAWGAGNTNTGVFPQFGQSVIPAGLSNVVAVAAGYEHNLVLRSDGSLLAWGDNTYGQTNIPAGLSNVVALAGGSSHSLALRSDGTVAVWGGTFQTNVPAGLSNVVAITAGEANSFALRSDGTIIGWGFSGNGALIVPPTAYQGPAITTNGSVNTSVAGTYVLTYSCTNAFGGINRFTRTVVVAAPLKPAIATLPATGITTAAATLNATVSPNGAATKAWFQYGLTTNYGSFSATNNLAATNSTLALSNVISGLQLSATYHFRVVATNSGGSTNGPDLLFVTAANPPIVTTLPASGVSNTVATLNGTVNPAGSATTAWFEWGFTANSQRTTNRALGNGLVVSNLNYALAGLTAGAVYSGRMVASNAADVVHGQEVLFGSPSLVMQGAAMMTNILGEPYVDAGAAAGTGAVAIAGGVFHSLALRADGTVLPWGRNDSGQLNIPAGLSNVIAISGSQYHNLALQSNGTITAWGRSETGQTNVPAGLSNVVAIGEGIIHSVALRRDGTVIAWGGNQYGQTNVPADLTNAVAIAGAKLHNLALRSDGTLVGWGDNAYGQNNIPPGLSNVVAIAAGTYHNLALRSDGTVASWGYNSNGQANVPGGLSGVVALAGGQYHSLALRSNGTVVAWGASPAGQANIPAGLSNVIAIAAGEQHSLALRSDGTIIGWGDNFFGQASAPASAYQAPAITTNGSVNTAVAGTYVVTYACANGIGGVSRVSRTVVVAAPSLPAVTTQPASSISSSAATLNGTVNPNGAATKAYFQYGLTTNYGSFTTTNNLPATNAPLTVANVINPAANTNYHFRLVAINSGGTSNGVDLTFATPAYLPVVTTLPASSVANTAATLNGTVNPGGTPATAWFEWGSTSIGQRTTNFSAGSGVVTSNFSKLITGLTPGLLYRGRLVASNSTGVVRGQEVLFGSPALALQGPAVMTNSLNSPFVDPGVSANGGVQAVVAGGFHGLALRSDGTLAAWGLNGNGQANIPTGLSDIVAVDAGNSHNVVLRKDGTLAAWGSNSQGQNNIPAGLTNVGAISAGYVDTLALRTDGSMAGWGYNGDGQTTIPASLTNVVAVAAGQYHTLVLRGDGTVFAWGRNDFGQTAIPAGLSNVIAISTGIAHNLALRSDGTVAAWGESASVPAGLSNVVAVAAGSYFSMALHSDGTVAAWGQNTSGQATVPAGLSNVVALSGGAGFAVALRSDGTLTAWGDNTYGQTNIPSTVYQAPLVTTNGTVNTSVAGTYVLTYTVTNQLGGVSTVSRTVIVPSFPPTLDPITNPAAINEDAGLQSVNLTGISAGGDDVQTLTVAATSGNTNVIPNPTVTYTSPNTNGSLSYTPVPNASGAALITVTVNDGGPSNNIVTRTFTVTVNAVNDPPTLDPIGNVTSNEDPGLQTINLTGISAGGSEPQTLIITAASGNTNLIPNPTVTYTSPNTAGSLSYTPIANASGSALITVTVNDGGVSNNIITRTFTVTVNPVNDPPTLAAINPASINEDAGLQTVNLTGISAGGGEVQTLTVSATSGNTNLIPSPTVTYTSPNTTGSLTYAPAANLSGTALITVTVNDGGASNNITIQTFTVTVNPVNDPPTLDPISNPAAIDEDAGLQIVNLAGITAGGGEVQTLTVTAISGNTNLISGPTVTYTSPNTSGYLTYTPVPNAYGTALITVTVNDGGTSNNITTRTFTVTVNPINDPPTLNAISDTTINEDTPQTVNLAGISAGPGEVQTLTITAASGNTNLIPNPTVTYTSPNTNGSLSYTPLTNASGSALITVTVNDGGTSNNIATRSFIVTVNPVNDMPVFTKGPDQTQPNGTTNAQTFVGWATGIDDGDPEVTQSLTFNITNSNPGLFTTPPSIAPNGTLTYKPNGSSGIAIVGVSLTDDATAGGPALTTPVQTFTITVDASSLPVPPIIDLQSLKILNDGSLQFNFTNTNNVTFSVLGASDVSLPAGNWTVLGTSTNIGGGLHQFTDSQATNYPSRFYRLRFP